MLEPLLPVLPQQLLPQLLVVFQGLVLLFVAAGLSAFTGLKVM